MLIVDDAKFLVVPPSSAKQAALAKLVHKEYGVNVRFIKKLNKKPYYVAFMLQQYKNSVFIRNGVSDREFNYLVFHEVRHVLQSRSGSHVLFRKGQSTGPDLIRYLFDCLLCELDADLFAIKECAARNLRHCKPGYLSSSNKSLKRFLCTMVDTEPYRVTKTQLGDITDAILNPLRGRQ